MTKPSRATGPVVVARLQPSLLPSAGSGQISLVRGPTALHVRADRGADKGVGVKPPAGGSMVAELDLLAFIRRSIPSVWALDVLLLVHKPPTRSWSAVELVGELRASDAVVLGVLAGFQRDGLIAQGEDGRFQFAPAAELLEELTVALAEAYAERPVAVINAIAASDLKLQTLADAFRLSPRRP